MLQKMRFSLGQKSLGGQLSWVVGIMIMIAILATGGLVFNQSEKIIRSLVVADLQRSTGIMNAQVNLLLSTVDSTTLPERIDFLMVQEANRLNQNGWEPQQWLITADGGNLIQKSQGDLGQEERDQILKQKTGVLQIGSGTGNPRTLAFQAIPEKGWFYVLEVSDRGYLAPVQKVRSTAITTAVIVLVVSIVLVLWMIRRMLKPLSSIRSVMGQVAKGDLTVRLEEKNVVSELAAVGAGLNSMLQKMGSMFHVLEQGIVSGKEASDALLTGVEKNQKEFRNTSSAMQEIEQGARQQASAMDQSVSSMESMSGQASHLVGVIQESSQVTNQIKRDIEQGLQVVEQNADRMKQVSVLTQDIDERVQKLANGMKSIREILASIQSIAGQTNLLALNASIEAARAGEAGRGFAVVAEEVRKLADESKVAADEILMFTESIEKEAEHAVQTTKNGKREVEHSVIESMRARDTIQNVHGGVSSTQEMVNNMVQVLEEWADQVQKLEEKLDSVRTVSKDTLESAEQVEKITEGQLQKADQLKQSTTTLVEIMTQLDQERRQFSI